jgi:hypothetical protein
MNFWRLIGALSHSKTLHEKTSLQSQITATDRFEHPNIPEVVNIQNRKGKAKPCQIRQFLELVEQYNLQIGEEE